MTRLEESPLPKLRFDGIMEGEAREEAALENRHTSEQFGELEFKMDTVGRQPNNFLAELGFDSATKETFKAPDGMFTARTVTDGFGSTVEVSANVATPAIWRHEFAHAGLKMLRKFKKEEDVKSKYGKTVSDAIFNKFTTDTNEAATELFDNPTDSAGALGGMSKTIQFGEHITDEDKENVKKALTDLAFEVLQERGKPDQAQQKQAKSWIMSLIFGEE